MKVILADIPDDEDIASSMIISSAEIRYMDALEMDDSVIMGIHHEYQMIPHYANKVASILGEVSPLCESQVMYQILKERREISQMLYALGTTMVAQESILIDHQEFSDNKHVSSTNSIHTMDDAVVDLLFIDVTSGSIDLDDYLVSLAHISSNVGVNEEHLFKVWRISPDTAGKALS
eukprot:6396423-Ditylum_brightwellii.AAC.1